MAVISLATKEKPCASTDRKYHTRSSPGRISSPRQSNTPSSKKSTPQTPSTLLTLLAKCVSLFFLLLRDPAVSDSSQQTGSRPQTRPAQSADELSTLDRDENASESVEERAQDQHSGTLSQDLGASAEALRAKAEVVGDSLRKVGVLRVELGRAGDGVQSAQQLVGSGDGGNEEEAGSGQAGGYGEQDLQHEVLVALVVQGAQVVEVGDHVDGQPGEGRGVEGQGVDGGAEDRDQTQDLPVAHDGARAGLGQLRVGVRGGGAREEGEGERDAQQVCGEGGQHGVVVGGVEGVEQVVVRQVAQEGERGEVEPWRGGLLAFAMDQPAAVFARRVTYNHSRTRRRRAARRASRRG
jgi:hypothetical protein